MSEKFQEEGKLSTLNGELIKDNRDASGKFAKGNTIAKVNRGGTKPMMRKEFKMMVSNVLDLYDFNDLYDLLEQINEPDKKLFYLMKLLELDNKRINDERRHEMEKEKLSLEQDLGADKVYEITYNIPDDVNFDEL